MSDVYFLNPFVGQSDPEPILRDVFDWLDNGIFTALNVSAQLSGVELPWDTEDAETLDLEYFGNHSGGKFCSPLVKFLLSVDGMVDEYGNLNAGATAKLAAILLRKYYTNWTALWRTNVASYDPIHNYNLYEERDLSTTEDNEEVTDGTLARTGTDTLEHGHTETTTHGRSNTDMTYRYGINTDTSDPKPSDKEISQEGGTTTTANSGSDIQRKNLQDKNDVTVTEDNTGTEHEEIHRYGNIGVTTTQKLIREERELWIWNYFDQVFDDLDRELALAFHDPCRV